MDATHFTRSKRSKTDNSILNPFSYTDKAIQSHNIDLELIDTNIEEDNTNTAKIEIADMESAEHEATVQSLLIENEREVPSSADTGVPPSELKCKVQDCVDKDSVFENIALFLEHHNRLHSMKPISRNRLQKLQAYHCGKCSLIFPLAYKCQHAAPSSVDNQEIPTALAPLTYWSVTITCNGMDIPKECLQLFEEFLKYHDAYVYICCLERGDKEDLLHIQAAIGIYWFAEEYDKLRLAIRNGIKANTFTGRIFKIQAKLFQPGQNWIGMIGYCVKYEGRRDYSIVKHPRVLESDIQRGRTYLSVYRADYTKDKLIITHDNLFKLAYSHWSCHMRPNYVTFVDVLQSMLISGNFVLNSKMLSVVPMDYSRAESAWKLTLSPETATRTGVHSIFFGRKDTEPPVVDKREPRYTVDQFKHSQFTQDFQRLVIERRENVMIVSPSGFGKSAFVHAMTYRFGTFFIGTRDELRSIPKKTNFLVFDDFDFTDLSLDTCKRLFDRDNPNQTVSARYNDAHVNRKICRIILCNSIPSQFDDFAVSSRVRTIQLEEHLFDNSIVVTNRYDYRYRVF